MDTQISGRNSHTQYFENIVCFQTTLNYCQLLLGGNAAATLFAGKQGRQPNVVFSYLIFIIVWSIIMMSFFVFLKRGYPVCNGAQLSVCVNVNSGLGKLKIIEYSLLSENKADWNFHHSQP